MNLIQNNYLYINILLNKYIKKTKIFKNQKRKKIMSFQKKRPNPVDKFLTDSLKKKIKKEETESKKSSSEASPQKDSLDSENSPLSASPDLKSSHSF